MKKAAWIGIPFVLALGTLLHFVYEWSGQLPLVGVFGAVNESIWEHLKLAFWPMLVYGVIEFFWYGRFVDSFLPIRALSVVGAMTLITVLYYTYSGVWGEHFLVADLLIYLISVLAAYLVSLRFLRRKRYGGRRAQVLAVALMVLCAACFGYFTFYPPAIGIFEQV